MASAKPIVAARAASVPEVVKHGILAQPDDEESLAEAIESLFANPSLRATLANEASDWVNRFDAPKVAATFLREVQQAAGTKALRHG
jgi:glycosyltransferase involved in cell wall biosynthesis